MDYVLKELNDSLKVTGIVNLHFFEFPSEFYTQSDSHPFYELVYVSSGKLNISSESYNGILDKGKIIIHKPNERHSLMIDGDFSPTVIIIGFTCKEKELDKFSKSPFSLSHTDVTKLAEIVKEGRNVFAPPYDVPVYNMKKKKNIPYGAEQMLKLLLEYFLIGILRELNREEYVEEKTENEKLSVSEIARYLDDNYKEKITIDELSFIFKTNRTTLCKEFKNVYNKTIIEYLNDKKILKAKEKIKNTNKTLTEISEELNFDSIHYFTRFFKKITGISPKEYRKNIKDN
jgi:AraC-like DNA-binding protein